MSRTIHEEKHSLKHYVSVRPFIEVIEPFLRDYKLPYGYWREDYVARDDDGNLTGMRRVFGDRQGAYLEHYISESSRSDGYSGDGGIEFLKSYQLVNPASGEKLELLIEISRLLYTNDQIRMYFEGGAGEVERLKVAVEPVLQSHRI